MPIYPYVCTACGHEFDALQKISEAPLTDCPACGESGLRKRLTAPSFKLKGTGWYETDFKNSKAKKAKDKDGDGKDDKAGKSDRSKEAGGKDATGTSPAESKSESGDGPAGAKSKASAASAGKDE
jgi:putative FmdB family regulatory protein